MSHASRSAYLGVPEEVLERISQAKTACMAARARYEAALATWNLLVILELEDELLKSEDKLKFSRIEHMRAKFSSQYINSSRSPLPPSLPDPALSLEQGEEQRYQGHGTSAYEDEPRKTANKLKLAGTERNCVEPFSQDSTTSPRSPLPSILSSPLLLIAT
ncbi:hypothetical protein K435DRAFT_860421 [Dendrothele bispora CBS 962.96]|uniref:Uncharacterized protein n=1 Tax=Dendrothele bispora (strain CBS 962.96) TaxID=1314807 RepID=A0A4S8LXW4_DENBC|nr:hypothetical protein K435DRAFT_860421 [Dendrothele bispora CBS 962.96]